MIVFHAREVHFEFNPATGELLREGKPVDPPLPDSESDLLGYFVHHPKETLTREQLQRAVWGGRFMAHDTVDKGVSVLRATLGDSAKEQSFIETVRKTKGSRERGYKFVAELKTPPPSDETKKATPVGRTTPAERDAIRAQRNKSLVLELEGRSGIKRCAVLQLEDHTDKGYLINVEFDPEKQSAAEVTGLIRKTLDEMMPPVPFWGQLMSESHDRVAFGYSYIDEHNRVLTCVSRFPEVMAKKPVQPTENTDGDWITAAPVARERAETELKKVASRAGKSPIAEGSAAPGRSRQRETIVNLLQVRIRQLLEKHAQGGTTDDTRLEACIAKVVAGILESELAEFEWAADERPQDDPVLVFRNTIKTIGSRHQ